MAERIGCVTITSTEDNYRNYKLYREIVKANYKRELYEAKKNKESKETIEWIHKEKELQLEALKGRFPNGENIFIHKRAMRRFIYCCC